MKLLASILAILFACVPLASEAQSRPVRVTVPGGHAYPGSGTRLAFVGE
jgi:hypothetical protein